MSRFALYRLPHRTACAYISDIPAVADAHDVSRAVQFVIHPFISGESTPEVRISGQMARYGCVAEIPDDVKSAVRCIANANSGSTSVDALPESVTEEQYKREFAMVRDNLRSHCAEKVVLSRRFVMECCADTFNMFAEATKLYPGAYVALFSSEESGTWLAASPELLLERVGGEYHTMALAGTMPKNEYQGRWTIKNVREQKIVTDYISDVLSSVATGVSARGPYTAEAGSLVHLRTDFTFNARPGVPMWEILRRLHPTPAVCGIPVDTALKIILDSEGSPRDYFTGYSGVASPDGDAHFYVTLRCMRVLSGRCVLYAGGGVLAESSEHMEWEETSEKLKTMKRIIENVQR